VPGRLHPRHPLVIGTEAVRCYTTAHAMLATTPGSFKCARSSARSTLPYPPGLMSDGRQRHRLTTSDTILFIMRDKKGRGVVAEPLLVVWSK
jgi:hypothetical protein